MKAGTIYNTQNGEVSRIVYAPTEEDVAIQCGEDEAVYPDVIDGRKVYIKDGKPVARPTMKLTVSHTTATLYDPVVISGIPLGSQVFAPGFEDTVKDGSIEWSSAVAGTFPIEITHFPDQPEVITVEITDL